MSEEAIKQLLPLVHGWLALKRAGHEGLDTPKARRIDCDCTVQANASARKPKRKQETTRKNKKKPQSVNGKQRLGVGITQRLNLKPQSAPHMTRHALSGG